MSRRYNAFISYRHHPVDSKVAAEIQRSLEHFYVPRATRKKTGVKNISRVFRDKEELPITSNLSDDITQALADADFLIVICSPRTSESVWVLREIKEFLRTHSRQQVLTVLAEGEPWESIPEMLLRETGEALWQAEYGCPAGALLSPDLSQLITVEGGTIRHLDPESGKLLQETPIAPPESGGYIQLSLFQGDSFSPDGRRLALRAYTGEASGAQYRIFLYDWQNGTGDFLPQSFYHIADVRFLDSARLAVMCRLEGDEDGSALSNSYFYTMKITRLEEYDVVCLSTGGGGTLWAAQVPFCDVVYMERLLLCPDGETLLCLVGGSFSRLDSRSGQVLGRCECESPILNVISCGDEQTLAFLAGGQLCLFSYEQDTCSSVKYYPDDLSWAQHNADSSSYVCSYGSDRVLAYRYSVADEGWSPYSGELASMFSFSSCFDGELCALIDTNNSAVNIFDMARRALLFSVDCGKYLGGHDVYLAQLSAEKQRLLLVSYDAILAVSTADGSLKALPLPLDLPSGAGKLCSNTAFLDERIIYVLSQGGNLYLCSCTVDGTELRSTSLGAGESALLSQCEAKLLIALDSGKCLFADISSGALATSQAETASGRSVAWSEDGSTAAVIGWEQIYMTDASGAVLRRLPLSQQTPLSCRFTPDGETLLFVSSDGRLHRYALNGEFLGSTRLPFPEALSVADSTAFFKWYFTDGGELMLGYNTSLIAISCSQWAVRSVLEQGLFYDSASHEMISFSNLNGFQLGSFPYYSTVQLLEKARAFIGDIPLSEETRSAYGLGGG